MNDYKLAFFIQLEKNKKQLENADIEYGNPGVGGTQYLFLLTVLELNRIYGDNYALLLSDTYLNLKKGLNIKCVKDENEAIEYCQTNKIEKIVLNANAADRINSRFLDSSVSIILWAHNTLNAKRQSIAAHANSIKAVVCVSKSQYNNMSDTPCFSKCSYINNIIPSFFYNHSILSDYSEEKAVYVGSLMPQKGSHNLLEIWKYVEKKRPNAKLYIFGGANVWNSKAKLGKGGFADPYYERILKKRIKKLLHPENVHFMGAKDWNYINQFISSFRVGIVNPSHYMRDETFCLSAVELSAHGLPVVSRQRNDGLTTTIMHKETGFLEKKDKDIAERIVEIISDENKCKSLGNNAHEFASRFVPQKEVVKWENIANENINQIPNGHSALLSNDSILLRRDFFLKIVFLLESGKFIDLMKKKLKIFS